MWLKMPARDGEGEGIYTSRTAAARCERGECRPLLDEDHLSLFGKRRTLSGPTPDISRPDIPRQLALGTDMKTRGGCHDLLPAIAHYALAPASVTA